MIVAVNLLLGACSSTQNKDNKFSEGVENKLEVGVVGEKPKFHYEGSEILFSQTRIGDEDFIIPEIEERRGDVVFRMKKIPTDLYLLNQGVNKEELDSVLQVLKGEQLFYIEFEEGQRQDIMKKYFEGEMDAPVTYMSSQIKEDFTVKTQTGKELTTNYCLYERNFYSAPFERILINFSGIEKNETLTLTYNDNLFGKGEIEFSFPSNTYITNINIPS